MYKRQYIPSTKPIDDPINDFKSTLLASKAYSIVYTTQDLLNSLQKHEAETTRHVQSIFAGSEANLKALQNVAKSNAAKEYYYGQVQESAVGNSAREHKEEAI